LIKISFGPLKFNKNYDNNPYKILINIIFGTIVSLSTIIILFILLIIIPFLYKVNALSMFYFKTTTDYLIVGGIIISIIVTYLSLLFVKNNIMVLSLDLEKKSQAIDETNPSEIKPDKDITKFLDENEKRIYFILIELGGTVLQRDLVGVDGFSRAKVSRILDRLERKGLVEKIRYGSTNKILVKRVLK